MASTTTRSPSLTPQCFAAAAPQLERTMAELQVTLREASEALEAHALDPVRFLVLPRLTATAISLVLLTILADVAAVACSGAVSIAFFDISLNVYIDNTLAQLSITDFLTGLLKAATFGVMLGAIACYNGLKVSGGAAGVGKATTDTVVQTIVAVIISDLIYGAVFLQLGWT